MRPEKGGRIWNTGPYSSARVPKSAFRLPSRTCGLRNSLDSGTVGIFLAKAACLRIGPARLSETASAMDRPIRSNRQTNRMRSSAASSSSKIKRKTSQVLTRHTMTTSLGSGISSVKMTLLIRALMNWSVEPSSDIPYRCPCMTEGASVQNSPSWCWRIPRSTRRSRVRSTIDSARGASRSIQYRALCCPGSSAISFRMGSRTGSPVSVRSTTNRDVRSESSRDRKESSASTPPTTAQFSRQPGT